jgi:CheY-like chemotaxis protein
MLRRMEPPPSGSSGNQTQLAAEVLHELRQPLLGIKAYVQMMSDDGPSKVSLSLLLGQVDRMEQIISDFTRLASDKPAAKERIDLSHHAREAAKLFALNPDSARVSLEVDAPQSVEISGNGRLIEQLVLNLLNNARDAQAGRNRVKLAVGRDAGVPMLYVADWGAGIAAELRERIFEPYVSTKSRGSGLGLAVCRRIAQEHQAQIGLAPVSILTEQPPPATVFRVSFNAERPASAARKRILVVDDESIIRMVFRDLMSKECDVVEAETAEEALSQLRRSAFDLIVTDKNLPGLSGLDLAQEARKLNPASRVILMTGYPSLVTAQQALELGVMDYLLKPFDEIREVRDKLRAALTAALPGKHTATTKRVDVYEDNPASAKQIGEALQLIGMEPKVLVEPVPGGEDAPAAVIVSWDFSPAHGHKSVELARNMSKGAPFIVLAEHLTMETTLESLRAGSSACLPKLLSDSRALSRQLARALKLPVPP